MMTIPDPVGETSKQVGAFMRIAPGAPIEPVPPLAPARPRPDGVPDPNKP